MSSWLIVYSRREGKTLQRQEFSDSGAAIGERFKAERDPDAGEDIEIVVLTASSLDEVRKTHSRYFGRA